MYHEGAVLDTNLFSAYSNIRKDVVTDFINLNGFVNDHTF